MEGPYSFESSTTFPARFSYTVTSSIDGITVTPTPITTQGN